MSKKKVAIICFLDGFANSVRPKEIKRFLEKRGHNVVLINTMKLYSLNKSAFSFQDKIHFFILGFLSRVFGASALVIDTYSNTLTKHLKPYVLMQQMKLRGVYLSKYLRLKGFNVIICESSFDAYVVTQRFDGITIYDSPSPWGFELYYHNKFTEKGFKKFQAFEKTIYKKASYLNFHWKIYTDFVKKNFYNGDNIIIMNYGVDAKPKKLHTQFKKPLKIIFLGYLEGYWVNLPLLAKLSKIYPIDVYGGPKPDKKWGLRYKGYAPSPDVLKDYQLGLITITDDKLRKSSFSSKHLEYISYGLPVLAPNWRNDPLLDDVTIKYSTQDFLKVVRDFEHKHVWEKMQRKCLEKSKEFTWEKSLTPLIKIIEQ